MEGVEERRHKEVVLVLTYGCNLRCSYCYEPKKVHKEMDFVIAQRILLNEFENVDTEKFDGISIQFMGGEPLMRFDLIRSICEWLWQQSFKIPILNVSFPTNGTMLDDNMRRWLSTHRDKIQPNLSFDGNRLMQNINRSCSAELVDLDYFVNNFPDAGVKMTLSPETLSGLFDGLLFLYQKGFTQVEANLAYGRHLKWGEQHLESLSDQLFKIVDFYISHPEVVPLSLVTMPVWTIFNVDQTPLRCQPGDRLVCYDCDGTPYPCHLFSPLTLEGLMLERARTIDFHKIRNSELKSCQKCLLKQLCLICYGSNYLDTGDCNNQSAFNCAQFKLFFFASCRYHYLDALKKHDDDKLKLISEILNLLTLSKDTKNED